MTVFVVLTCEPSDETFCAVAQTETKALELIRQYAQDDADTFNARNQKRNTERSSVKWRTDFTVVDFINEYSVYETELFE